MSNFLKKSFLISVMVLTVFGTFGFALGIPVAQAATAGDLIRTDTVSAVYYLDSANKRHPFHHANQYFTWYTDFSSVKTIPVSEMSGYDLGSTIVVRPGTKLVQFVSLKADGGFDVDDPKVYAVSSNGSIMHVDSAATAVKFWGSAWETMILGLPNFLFGYYTAGAQLTSSSMYPTGSLVKMANSSQVYYVDGSTKRPVTDAGLTANRFNMAFVTTASDLSTYTSGSSVTGTESALSQPVAGTVVVTPPPTSGTGLTVALAADNPGAQLIPISATGATLMKFNLTAGSDGAVTVSQINVKQGGVGDANDFAAYYLYDGSTRLTNSKTLNSTTRTAQFAALGLSIPAGTTKTLSLVADVATVAGGATAGGYHFFMVESGAITTSATTSGSFPISGNGITIGSVAAGDITIALTGTMSNPVVGQNDADLAQFKLTAGTSEDLAVTRIALYQTGSINNSYLTNFKLWQGSTQLGSAVASITNKGLVIFDLSASPYTLAKNTNKILKVTGNVSGSARNADTSKFYLESGADLYAVGKTYGYGAAVTSTSYDGADTSCTTQATCDDSNYLIVQGGQLTIAKKGPVSGTLAKGANGVIFLTFSITAGLNAEIRKMRVELHNDDGVGSELDKDAAPCSTNLITNVRIVDTDNGESTSGIDCSGFSDVDSLDGVYYDYTDYFLVAAGKTRNFAVKADLASSLTANDYYVVLGKSGTNYATSPTDIYTISTSDGAKNTDNNQWITDIVPTTNITGNEMTVATSSLGIAKASNTTGVTVVQGTRNVDLGEFAFNTGAGSDVTITSMTFNGYIASTSPTGAASIQSGTSCTTGAGKTHCIDMAGDVFSNVSNLVTNLRIYDMTADPTMTTNLNTTNEGFSSSDGTVAFTNMRWVIPKSSTHKLRVVADTTNTAYANGRNGNKHVKVNIAAATDVSAQDSEGGSVTLTDDDLTTAYVITDATISGNGLATTMASSYYITIAETGSINVTAQDNPAEANVVAGASMVPMLNLKFQATNEAFNVNKFRIFHGISSTYHRAVRDVTISYQNQAGATVTSTLGLTSGNADFNITDNPLYVPSNGSRVVVVYFNLAAINQTSAAYTGDIVSAQFDFDTSFEAKGAGDSSTNKTTTSGANVIGNTMTLHGTLLTFTAETTAGILANGLMELYKFQVTAAEGTDLTLKKLSFKLAMTDSVIAAGNATLSLTNFEILEGTSYGNASVLTAGDTTGSSHYQIYNGWGATATTATGIAGGKLSAATGVVYHNIAGNGALGATASATRDVIVVFNDDRLISNNPNDPNDGSKYYILRATAGAVDVGASSNDSLSMYLFDGDTASNTTTGYRMLEAGCDGRGVGLAAGKYCLSSTGADNDTATFMIWSDSTGNDGNNTHTDIATGAASSSKDWFNGYKVKTLNVSRGLN